MPADAPLLPTTVVGSHPQPDWLIDREALARGVPRTERHDLWRVAPERLREAQDEATVEAIRAMEEAGIDIVTDGEMRRVSYSERFATALDGVDTSDPARVVSANGLVTEVPRVVGRVRRVRPVEVRDMELLRATTTRTAKITLPGPFTMSQQAVDEHYGDVEELVMDLAAAVNEEAHELVAAGADVIQLDEPWVRQDPELARRCAVAGIDRALRGLTVPTVVHVCFGYAAIVPGSAKPAGYPFLAELADCAAQQISIEAAQPRLDLGVLDDLVGKRIVLGVLDLADPQVEAPETVAERIRAALARVAPEDLVPAPDCGMKYLPVDTALGKLRALARGAAIVRAELA
ncbi:MAG TPA: cobalamin-independent methionine synthase II family protein [Solirubrobacteraceae bacterium]|nr:cobalamin-independent methionine synthase II family protein [Solirubrobacteraceae bacterium]